MQPSQCLMFVVLVAAVTGCRNENVAGNVVGTPECIQRPRSWGLMDDPQWGVGIEGLDFYHIDVGYGGSLRWGSEALGFEQVKQYLHTVDSMQTAPPVVLRATPDSPCVLAERVRRVMDSLKTCRAGGCYEDEQWVALGYPTYGEYYRPDGRRRYE